ncbi:MaoC family dehydratase N-terminal domain-containing protein [Saccharomonospora saliphila]|uniref:MaoC family dehydratase N-terminal domain-containing protein n=1 Tax=Saccharomonospora saliphila TaxID=369829 RepID=UPI000379902B|nr:MaoC family dehydratase N-terminal domain-containing protein [Saccharomonospora saliphila]
MALDRSFIGRSYPPTSTYEVGRAKIAEFADAIGDDNPLYRDPEAAKAAGYPDVIAPPTFLTIVNLTSINAIASDPELGLDYARMVHGDQRFTHSRPVHAGDELELTTSIDDVFTRAGNDFLSVRADIRTTGGEHVCTSHAQLVVRGE